MPDRSIFYSFSWEENEEDIKNDIIQYEDIPIIDSYVGKPDDFFLKLDVLNTFIDEVHRISREHKITLIRAFWIVNIVYRTYFKKSRIKTMDVFYHVRKANIEKQKQMKKLHENGFNKIA